MQSGHKKQWEFLKNKLEQNQLSHAYLFAGADGIGKKTFAKEFSEFAGCKFPDLKIIAKKEDKTELDIAQIREAQNFLSYKSYNGGYKIVIVDGAENMNSEAQNCFLKSLEEPKGQTLIILISSKPDILLPTIISRCQTIKFSKSKDFQENHEKSEKEKELLKNLLPVINSTFAEKFKYVKNIDFEKQSAIETVQTIQKYFRTKMLEKIGTSESEKLKKILRLTEEINNKLIFTNANPKLALEILLMEI